MTSPIKPIDNQGVRQRQRQFSRRNRQLKLISKLKQILSEQKEYSGIRMRGDAKGFVIQNINRFQSYTLPKYFKKWPIKKFYKQLQRFPFQPMNDYYREPSFANQQMNLQDPKSKLLTQWQKLKKLEQHVQVEGTIKVKQGPRNYNNRTVERNQSETFSQEDSSFLMLQIQSNGIKNILNMNDQRQIRNLPQICQEISMFEDEQRPINPDLNQPYDNIQSIIVTIKVIIQKEKNPIRRQKCIKALKKINSLQDPKVIQQIHPQNQQKLKDLRITIKIYLNQFQRITKVQQKYNKFKLPENELTKILLQIQKNIDPNNMRASYFQALKQKFNDRGWTQQFLQQWVNSVQKQKANRQKRQKERKEKMQQVSQVPQQNQVPIAQKPETKNVSLETVSISNQGQPNKPMKQEEQNYTEENEQKLTQQIVRLHQQYEQVTAQTFFYQRIRQNPDLRIEDVIFTKDHSSYFRAVFSKNLHSYKINKLKKIIHKMATVKNKKRKLPYTVYKHERKQVNPNFEVRIFKISERMERTESEPYFYEDALELVHDNHNVDIDEFFKYDWSRFEVMSFNNCGLRTADLVKMSRNALEMLPNLKHLYLNDNRINLVRKNDLMKFESIKKIELYGNILDLICEEEIQNFQNERQRGVIVARL